MVAQNGALPFDLELISNSPGHAEPGSDDLASGLRASIAGFGFLVPWRSGGDRRGFQSARLLP